MKSINLPVTLLQAGTGEDGITTLTFMVCPDLLRLLDTPLPLYREAVITIEEKAEE